MDNYAERALLEYNSEETSPHPGGINGRPYWNINSSQFMFAPKLQFPNIHRASRYIYTAEDKNGMIHSFIDKTPSASLAPIWEKIPEGFVTLKVEGVDRYDNLVSISGVRRFFKCAPVPGRDVLPPKAKSYRQCAVDAYRFIYNDPMVRYWLDHGVPMPNYPHNVYPAKTIESIVRAMVEYSKLEPENAENAIKLARRAADYLLSISFDADHPLAYLPPTYCFKGLDVDAVNAVAPAAWGCQGTTMMIYPVAAAEAYLELADATGDEKYFTAALRIAEYYKANVLPCGSWYLLYDCETGKPLTNNICVNFKFVNFFHKLYKKTGNEEWHELELGCYRYISEVCLKSYNWEGQFEDVKVSGNYQNLTHFTANDMISYVCNNLTDDAEMVAEAVDLMRFVEDQFVIWGEFPQWNSARPLDKQHTPTGLEQYFCYCPIDASSMAIMNAFLSMYSLNKDRLYLEKAMALGDAITRAQNKTTGQVPTFLIGENYEEGYRNFWINCHIYTASSMMHLADITEAEGIE